MAVSAPTKLATVWSMPVSLSDETKDFDFNAKKGILSGYMTLFNSPVTGLPYVDTYLDVVEPGLCTKTIQELEQGMKYKNIDYLIPYLWQHKPEGIIGGVKHLGEDTKGVTFENHLARGVQQAEEALILLEQKMMAGISYGYDPIRYLPQGGRRHLKEIRLHELSQVTFPAHEYAAVQEIKTWANGFYRDGKRLYPGYTLEQKTTVDTKQARDFDTLWQNRAADETMHELYTIGDILQQSMLESMSEAGVDPVTTVDGLLAQARPKLLAWAGDFQLILANPYTHRDGNNTDMNEMMGYMGLDMSTIAFKTATERLTKEGRKISAARRTRLENALQTLTDHMKDIQAILDETAPTSTQTGKGQTPASPLEAMNLWFEKAGTSLDGFTPNAPPDGDVTNFLTDVRNVATQLAQKGTV